MPRPALPKPKDLDEVLRIARALDAEGYSAGAVHVAPDGGWSVSWAKSEAGRGALTLVEQRQARRASI